MYVVQIIKKEEEIKPILNGHHVIRNGNGRLKRI
jgi:hypothetical protein